MALVLLVIGLVLIISAVRNSQGALYTALETDVPKFVVWGAAIIAVGLIGTIPGLKPISRWLLALVIVVLIVNNYKRLITGVQNAISQSATQTSNAPSAMPAPATNSKGQIVSPTFGDLLADPFLTNPANAAAMNSPIDNLDINVPGG